ncbi:MAG: HEPN domain-containing protein [Nitrospira sp.]
MNPEAADFWARALQALRTAVGTASADPDAAASRAYYAAFYAVSALFALEERTFSRHSALEAAVHRDLVKAQRWSTELGEDYAFLLRLRTTGDYGGDLHVAEEEAQVAIQATHRILCAVQTTRPELFPKVDNPTTR